MNISLGQFERQHGVNKGTASRKARDLGFATADGLTPEAYKALLTEFNIDTTAQEPAQPEEPAQEPLEVTVLGTCTPTMEAPTFNSSVALARLRGGSGDIAAYADPMAAIEQALSLFDAAESAMAADLAQRQSLLQQTQSAARAMAAKAAQLQAQQAEYRIKSDVMAMLQNQEQANLGELLGKAAALAGEPS